MAYYNKTTEKTSIDRKIADTDVTSELSTSKELGLYQSYNPTGFAPVTNQVREFDWGTKVQPAINTVVGGITNTAVSTVDYIANHPKEVIGTVALGAIAVVATLSGQLEFALPAILAIPTLYTDDNSGI